MAGAVSGKGARSMSLFVCFLFGLAVGIVIGVVWGKHIMWAASWASG